MEQSSAVWLIIILSLVTANLPFVVQRPLLPLPWGQKGEPARPAILRLLESLVFFALLYGVCWLAYEVISTTLVMYTSAVSIAAFYGKLVAYIVIVAGLMYYPGWRVRHHQIEKSFLARLLEVFVLYLLIGVLAFALELNLGNRFVQTWEFYAITGSLYLVLGYPGFVWRYLMKRRKPARPRRTPKVQAGKGDAADSPGAKDTLVA